MVGAGRETNAPSGNDAGSLLAVDVQSRSAVKCNSQGTSSHDPGTTENYPEFTDSLQAFPLN